MALPARQYLRDDSTFVFLTPNDIWNALFPGMTPPDFPFFRPLLAAPRDYFVRTDGSDTNSGLVDSPGGAFRTWNYAVLVARSLDDNGHLITIQAGNEGGPKTFAENISIGGLVGSAGLRLTGNGTPANTIIFPVAGSAVTVTNSGLGVTLDGLTVTATGALTNTVEVQYRSGLDIGPGIIFDNVGGNNADIYVHDNQAQARILNAAYTKKGNSNFHIEVVNGGHAFHENSPIAFVGAPAMVEFVRVTSHSSIQFSSVSWTGAPTGSRYGVYNVSLIQTFGGGPNYLPGNAPGTADAASFGFYS